MISDTMCWMYVIKSMCILWATSYLGTSESHLTWRLQFLQLPIKDIKVLIRVQWPTLTQTRKWLLSRKTLYNSNVSYHSTFILQLVQLLQTSLVSLVNQKSSVSRCSLTDIAQLQGSVIFGCWIKLCFLSSLQHGVFILVSYHILWQREEIPKPLL